MAIYHTHTHTISSVHTHKRTHNFTYTFSHTHTISSVHTHKRTHNFTYTFSHTHTHIHTQFHTYTQTHFHTHILSKKAKLKFRRGYCSMRCGTTRYWYPSNGDRKVGDQRLPHMPHEMCYLRHLVLTMQETGTIARWQALLVEIPSHQLVRMMIHLQDTRTYSKSNTTRLGLIKICGQWKPTISSPAHIPSVGHTHCQCWR